MIAPAQVFGFAEGPPAAGLAGLNRTVGENSQ
jgi:hypothetical protein